MKILKKYLAGFIALTMMTALLPAQYALAAEFKTVDEIKEEYHIIYGTEGGYASNDFTGHVLQLERNTDASKTYDYSLTVSLYNANYATTFLSNIIYDTTVLKPVTPAGKDPKATEWTYAKLFTPGVTGDAHARPEGEDDYTESTLDETIFQAADVTRYTSTNISDVIGEELDSKYTLLKTALSTTLSGEFFQMVTVDKWDSVRINPVNTDFYEFKPPVNELYTLYTAYFKFQDGKSESDITTDTFVFKADTSDDFLGSGSFTYSPKDLFIEADTDTYLIGFVEPVAPDQTVSFTKIQNSSNGALSAQIYLYTDSSRETPVTGHESITTEADGSATVSLPGNKQYWYTVKATGYADYEGTFTIPEAAGQTVNTITMTSAAEQTASATVTVIDADTSSALQNVELTFDSAAAAETTKTNDNGQFTKELTIGSHSVVANLDGYDMYDATTRKVIANQSFSVKLSGGNNVSVRMVPDRIAVALPTVTSDKGSVSGTTIAVKRVSGNSTDAWGDGSNTQYYQPGDTAQLPNDTEFSVTISASGCTPQTVYVKTEDGVTKYYADENFEQQLDSSPFESDFVLEQLSDPYYSVDIVTEDNETYVATVKLHNVQKAVTGTFGLQYDKTVFDYDPNSIVISDSLMLHNPLDTADLAVNVSDSAVEIVGYHVFTWQGKKVDAETGFEYVEASSDGIQIATMTFTKKENASNKDITANAFTVMPFDKTAEGVRVLKDPNSTIDVGRSVLDPLWRYCDEKNEGDEDSLEIGRIHKSKSILNGFYQVYPLVNDGASLEPVMYDVMTSITTNFEAEKGSLTFIVTDEETNVALSGAIVHLCSEDGEEITTLTTDIAGMVSYPVNSTSDETFKYWVECRGYWNEPDDLSPATMKETTVNVKTNTDEDVPMEKKIYHQANLYDRTDKPIPATELTLSNDIAYNGRDFYFSVVPAAGKKLIKAVKDIKFQVALDVDGKEYKALAETDYDATTNTWLVKGTLITGDPNKPDDIDDVHGYKSHDIKVKIVDPLDTVIADDNTPHGVTANAGSNGGVIYSPDEGQIDNEEDEDGVKVVSTDRTDGHSNCSKVTISNIKPTEEKELGKFTFTADDGFMVEKVYVNGVDISDLYQDKTTFDYTFEDLTVDNDITVTFYNGTTPSDDTVMTLVVGYDGTVDVSKPESITGVTNTRKVFVNPTDVLEFTAKASDENHELYQVRKSVDDQEIEDITSTGSAIGLNKKFTVAKPDVSKKEKHIVVYVDFKDKEAEEPTYVMITSYVKSGEGTIAPTGIFPLNKSFNFTVKMTPAKKAGSGEPESTNGNDWVAWSVDVNGTEYVNPNSNKRETYEYTVTNIMTDTKIGAVFTETAYKVTGLVDLSQASEISLNRLLSGATVTCERINPDTGRVNMTLKPVMTTGVRNNSTFVVEMPAGTWNITVSKRGYVDYTITGFEVGGDDENITFGLKEGETNPKKITPYIGNATGTGKSVSLLDFGIISNGLRAGANSDIRAKGDVNDDDSNDINDVTYEKRNYGRRASTISYEDWLNN